MKSLIILSIIFSSNLFAVDVKKDALKQTKDILAKMSTTEKAKLGFDKNIKIDQIKLGTPYQFQIFSKEFLSSSLNKNQNPIVDSKQLRYPVMVNGKYVSLVTMYKKNGKYTFGSIGAAQLARELYQVEKRQNNFSAPKQKFLIRNLDKQADVVRYGQESLSKTTNFVPLKSFGIFLKAKKHKFQGENLVKESLTLSEIHRLMK